MREKKAIATQHLNANIELSTSNAQHEQGSQAKG
jgi:hypothetical protein